MDRLVRRNVLALSGRAVEASGDVDVLLLDKTGTGHARQPPGEAPRADAWRGRGGPGRGGSDVSRSPTTTPEGRSIVGFGSGAGSASANSPRVRLSFIAFTAETRMSGVDLNERVCARARATRWIAWVTESGGQRAAAAAARARQDRPLRAGPRSPVARRTTRSSASSTSRTSSRRGCASASLSCVRWASEP